MSAKANYHKLDSLKQKFILTILGPKAQNQNIYVGRATFPTEALGRTYFLRFLVFFPPLKKNEIHIIKFIIVTIFNCSVQWHSHLYSSFLAFLDVPCLLAASMQFLPHVHVAFVCVCVSFSEWMDKIVVH